MDEFQGRLGTQGALVRKGAKPEAEALPALLVPDLTAVTVSNTDADALLSAEQKRILIAELRKTVSDEDCDGFAKIVSGDTALSVYQLSGEKRTVSAECWRAAYDSGAAYWVINKRQPFAPVIVVADATDYVGGTIFSIQKGRGLGDFWTRREWTWAGKRFVLSAESSTGMCRLIAPGNAWELPTLVTKVNNLK
jgi:hypothetical protein